MINFGRDICGDSMQAGRRQWLVTNGIGGFASGTIAGFLTSRYQGYLIAALQPPLGRTLLVTKFDESVTYLGSTYPLYSNQWKGREIYPHGFRYIERFHLEGTIPTWTFAFSEIQLVKQIWMQQGENTTYISYYWSRPHHPFDPSQKLSISLACFINYRDYHGTTRMPGGPFLRVDEVDHGLRVTPVQGGNPYYLLAPEAGVKPGGDWKQDYYLSVEAERGLPELEDHYCAGIFELSLQPGDRFTLIASTFPGSNLDAGVALAERHTHEEQILQAAKPIYTFKKSWAYGEEDWIIKRAIQQLVLAADQFIVQRTSPTEKNGNSIIAGYPWFSDWGRDTMISLPGLTISTGGYEIARRILHTFAAFVDRGMLPNRFPDIGEALEYNTVDATLWYFEAINSYLRATSDVQLIEQVFPVLEDIIHWHLQGTRYQIHVDPGDGLLYAGEPGVQLTWMDAKVNDWVVTPRIGKPVEINALWYNALSIMVQFSQNLGKPAQDYQAAKQQALSGFSKFWNYQRAYCYDVIDGPDGNEANLRPNQLFAVSLPYSPLNFDQQKAIIDACAQELLTSHGLRSLGPDEPGYRGKFGGDRTQRDGAYHQGTVWGWLIGPFISAHLRVYSDPQMAFSFLRPFIHHLSDHGLGTISEIFDGDPPFTPHGCIAQAWSVAELLRTLLEIQQFIGKKNE